MAGAEEPSLDNTLDYATRVGTFIIGSGIRGQAVWAAPLLLGLVLVGGFIGASAGTGVVAGSLLGVVSVVVLASVGLAPMWLRPVVLFLIALVLTGLYVRTQ
jgi:hypothetical protein